MTAPISRIMHFPANTRLMCPNCGTISSRHKAHSPREEYYWDTKIPPSWVSLHTCHRCGYTDNQGDGFTDSGNDDSDDFRELPGWEKELGKLEDQVEELKYRIKKAKARWVRYWESDEDVY